MQVKNIYLENFRNYDKRTFDFAPETTLVVGPNTAGKSNLLEAIFLLSSGFSPRADLDREMVKSEIGDKQEAKSKFAFVRGTITGSEEKDLEVILTETGKRFRVNGVARRKQDFVPHFHAVLFSPEDLNLVTGAPDLRRRFLDFALGSVDAAYDRSATAYDQVRKNRNRLLEQIHKREVDEPRREEPVGAPTVASELGFWDAKLLEHGVFLQDKRKEFFDELNHRFQRGPAVGGGLQLAYLPSGLTAERLLEFRPREIAAETSLIGPHRDDFGFQAISDKQEAISKARDLAAFGSRGEQRKAVLALKKAELEFVEQKVGSRPVLLLDDIFSELDEENRANVFELLGEGQTIVTTTDTKHLPEELLERTEIIQI